MNAAISLKGVTKGFGSTKAVQNLDLEIPQGALYGFIGPNGAGKTTSIRMIMSILFPDSGELSVLGRKSALEAKDRIGYLPEERGVYRKMKVGAFISYIAQLKGVNDPGLAKRIRESLEAVGLGGVERKRCEELSKGMTQKVQFLAAIVHKPDLLILDEPFSGLDPVSSRMLRELVLAESRRGATILFSTHVMPHAEELCDTVIMVHQGRKVLDEKVASIKRRYDPRSLQFEPLDPAADLSPIRSLPGVERVDRAENGYEISLAEGTPVPEAMQRIIGMVTPARIELSRPRLEDVFVRLVTASSDSGEDAEKLRATLRESSTGAATA
jgi:ABC-2 type transport system ATP-binding protein